jgi:hypothetical protein
MCVRPVTDNSKSKFIKRERDHVEELQRVKIQNTSTKQTLRDVQTHLGMFTCVAISSIHNSTRT